MKKIILLGVSVAILGLLTTNVYARNGIYLSLEGGWAKQSGLPSKSDAGATSIDTRTFPSAVRAAVGYNHDLNCRFGVGLEVGIGQYGEDTYHFPNQGRFATDKDEIKSRTLEFLGAARYHIRKVDIFAKIGGIRQTMSKVRERYNEDNVQTQIRTEAVIGTAYNFNSHVAATLSYAHVFGQNIERLDRVGNETPTLNEVLLGIRLTC